ncbi:MAG: hypothetical protein P2A85_22145 [Microcoleus anatoxicus]|uniref:hypothetical protein n=1 Tax=Microcoleus anatoxicus TaxID=2705319 RepID=UPI00367331D8
MAYQIQYTLKNYCKWVEFAGKGDRPFGYFGEKGDRNAGKKKQLRYTQDIMRVL